MKMAALYNARRNGTYTFILTAKARPTIQSRDFPVK